MPDDRDRSSNPLKPFTDLIEGLNPTDSDASPAMFPLSPFAIFGGQERQGTASPEEGTKRAVRQLYAVLAGLSSDSPQDAWKQLLDTAVFDAPGFTVEKLTGVTATTYRIWFHSLAQLLVESFTLQIVHEELVVEDHRRTTETGRWLWRLPQADREQLLRRCTGVDDEIVDEMQAARRHRDELLYDFGSWGDIDAGASLADARQHLRVLTALEDYVTDGTVFSYFPSGADALEDDE
jgi:hypothetical protein